MEKQTIDDRVRNVLRSKGSAKGKKLEAIKMFYRASGCTLLEAKKAVERLMKI